MRADIISMASGFRDSHRGMEAVIREANQDRALVFAAVCNCSGMRRVTFPARLKYQVFCIFTCNAYAKIAGKSAVINPSSPNGPILRFWAKKTFFSTAQAVQNN